MTDGRFTGDIPYKIEWSLGSPFLNRRSEVVDLFCDFVALTHLTADTQD